MTKHINTNIDSSRSPLFIPYAILGVLSILAFGAVGLALR